MDTKRCIAENPLYEFSQYKEIDESASKLLITESLSIYNIYRRNRNSGDRVLTHLSPNLKFGKYRLEQVNQRFSYSVYREEKKYEPLLEIRALLYL